MAITTAAVTNSIGAIYTSSGSSVITYLSLCNYSVGDISIDFYVVPSGGSADDSTIVYSGLLIAAGDTHQLYTGNEKLILTDSDTIQVLSNTISGINAVTSYMPIALTGPI
jgi:hypothetical protein